MGVYFSCFILFFPSVTALFYPSSVFHEAVAVNFSTCLSKFHAGLSAIREGSREVASYVS